MPPMVEHHQSIFVPSAAVDQLADAMVMFQAEDMQLQLEIGERNRKSFENRYEFGKLLFENQDLILTEFGTWKKFAEYYAFSPSVLSNNKRAYEFLHSEGLGEWSSALAEIKKRGIAVTVSSFEKIESLFVSGPRAERPKLEKRLETLYTEAKQIVESLESAHHNELKEMAVEVVENIEQAQRHVAKMDVKRQQWHNEKYLEFVRSFGVDAITGKPVERCEPHHTYIHGEQGDTGMKLPDYLTIPLSPETHRLIETGQLKPDPIKVAEELIRTMGLFIQTHIR
jgi:hypothetical protein